MAQMQSWKITLKKENDDLINIATTELEDKDITKTQLETIVKQRTTITNLMLQPKAQDADINQLREGEKTWDINTPVTGGKWIEGKHVYDNIVYWWNHVYLVTLVHTNKICSSDKQKPDHKE